MLCQVLTNMSSKYVKTLLENHKPFQCQICSTAFGQKSNLNMHIKTVHEHLKPFKCQICLAAFGQKSTLEKHEMTVHEKLRLFHE